MRRRNPSRASSAAPARRTQLSPVFFFISQKKGRRNQRRPQERPSTGPHGTKIVYGKPAAFVAYLLWQCDLFGYRDEARATQYVLLVRGHLLGLLR